MQSHPKYQGSFFRTISESRILDHIVMLGHAHDVRGGRESQARLTASRALERATLRGLAFERSASGDRLFDPPEALNHLIRASVTGVDDYWETHSAATSRQMVRDFHGTGPGDPVPSIADLQPRRFRVRIERDFDLTHFEPGSQVRLRLPAPLSAAGLTGLEMRASTLEDARISSLPGSFGYQFSAGSERRVTLALDASFEASPSGAGGESLTPSEFDLYTRAAEGFVQVDASTRELAASTPPDPQEAVGHMFDLVAKAVRFGLVQYGDFDKATPSSRMLRDGWADCHQATALFCALCRARGIPARLICGYFLYSARSTQHFWAEVWVEGRGWLPYDFFEVSLSGGGREPAWRGIFRGVLDYRVKLQVFPTLFTGTGSISFPRWWHMASRIIPSGIEATYEDARTGALIFRERFLVRQD
ncbi:MAG: transglutaminase-like domain-containing protein [Pseudomonadota bacterium]